MKTAFFILLLFVMPSVCFAQKQAYWDDLLVRNYNYFLNKPFAELELEDTSGKLIRTASLAGKTVYVDFWFTTCGPCLKEIPDSKSLQQKLGEDTNVVFLSICIENLERKQAWKQLIKEKEMPGIHLFYVRNRPQKTNLLREYKITFPTYLLVNKEMKVIGYDAPRPSEKLFVYWAISQAKANIPLSESYKAFVRRSKEYLEFLDKNVKL